MKYLLLVGALLLFSLSFAQDRTTTLVMGGDFSDLITLDPGQSYEFSGTLVLDNIYERLVRFEGTDLSEVKPGLAESWTVTPEGDGNKITFVLRDATFSSGNPVTAADVVYSIERVIKNAEAGVISMPSSFLITDVAKLAVGSVVAVDDKTVDMILPADVNPNIVLNLLTFNIGGIVDSKVLMENEVDGDFGNAYLQDNSAGSGPYMLERWDRDAQVILVANPNNTAPKSIERVLLRYMKESSVQQAAVQSGEIDVSYDPTPEFFNSVAEDPAYQALKTDNFQIQYLGMNSGEGAPFADNRVRDAVRYAVDQDAIINDLLSGLGLKSQTIIPSGLLGFDDTIYFEHDPEQAKALLAEAGAEGLSFEFLVSDGACGGGVPCGDLAAKIQSDLEAVGLVAEIRVLPQSELLPIYRAQEAQMVLVSWSPDYPDPDGNATPLADFDAESLAWRNVWQNETASQLAKEASLELDNAKREELYRQLTELVAKEGPYMILYQPYKPLVVRAEVKGLARSAQGDIEFDKISKE
jgi:peptide/nickel transport system substrate-binding protein